MRSFIALEVPDELRKKIAILQEQLAGLGVKLIEQQNLHFTLKFLGDVEEPMISEVSTKLKEIATNFKRFNAVIKTVGVFPSLNYLRVIWLGCEEIFPLQQSVESSLSYLFKKEKPSPHLTIARVRPEHHKDKIPAFIEKNKGIEIGSFVASEIKLKKSTLTPEGPVYEDIEAFQLG